ncbi:hypothetical protein [Synechococcus sp. GFB01]|uniref:hypothetical protein n=1 Tax=Synechococcus sp. GFB01 TaxID=1662190 RepID=UPI00064F894C|nr:hypothetical protein [Synechococcus sp. GFB01]KMM17719.1 hypothetical protein SYNGFB01_02165 [Synechococcus sp. GFB01]
MSLGTGRSSPRSQSPGRLRPAPIALLLGFLALLDLREELQLLAQHFTFTALWYAVVSHPLAVVVLLLLPRLWRRG